MADRINSSLPNKDKWLELSRQDSVQVGNYNIRKNDYGTVGNAILDTINFIPEVADKATTTAAAQFKTSNDSTLMAIVEKTVKGRFGIDVTKMEPVKSTQETLSTLGGNFFRGSTRYNPNTIDLGEGFGNALGASTASIFNTVGTATSIATKKVENLIAPTNKFISSLDNIGVEFDKIIQDTFLGQVFKIKGSEILCSMFCILISMLSCKDRQNLYESVMSVKAAISQTNAVITGVNDLTSATAVEVPLFQDKTIADNVRTLFSSQQPTSKTESMFSIPNNTNTKKPTVQVEAPPNVASTIKKLTMILSVIAKGQITVPVGINGSIWDIAQAILSVIQTMVVQTVDEFLTRIVKDIESQLKKMVPQICVGNLASMFINKIMNAIQSLKNFLMQNLKQLFGTASGFGVKWKTFGWYFKEIQDLLAMLKALGLLLKNFADLALLCGIQPCGTMTSEQQKLIRDAVRNGKPVQETNDPANVLPIDQTPQGKTLDELSNTFSSMGPKAQIIPSDDGFKVVMPQIYKDAPNQIRNIINSPEFLNELGSAYTVYTSPDMPFINIVYTYKLSCGDK